MSIVEQAQAVLEDLYATSGKAELVDGRIMRFMPTGRRPGRIVGRIYRSLADFVDKTGLGEAYPDNVGFVVPCLPSGRQSFAPDAAYYAATLSGDPMRFVEGPPALAVEVRSENDYTDLAEEEMSRKRADYFAAGTLVVWDVDPINELIHVYGISHPDQPTVYRRGQFAEAGSAVPGWKVSIDWLFD